MILVWRMLLLTYFTVACRPFVLPAGRSAPLVARKVRFSSASQALRSGDDDFASFSTKVTVMFPGQGAQFVGMAKQLAAELPEAKRLFDTASEILNYDLLQRCVEGPKSLLDSTAVSQPAIFVSSMSALALLRSRSPSIVSSATCCAGLSLGEYSALCFAESISFTSGVLLTQARGLAMQAASDASPSGMVSVIGCDRETAERLCKAASLASGGEDVRIANYLGAGNYVLSGASKACSAVVSIAKKDFGARMTRPLSVAGAFHTPFMKPAVEALEKALKSTEITKPRIPVICNVDARPHSDPNVIKELLLQQVTQPVQWEQTMDQIVRGGCEQAFELGPGKVLTGLLKKHGNHSIATTNVEV